MDGTLLPAICEKTAAAGTNRVTPNGVAVTSYVRNALSAGASRLVKSEFLHKNFPMVKSTTREKVGKFSKGVASDYVNQK